MGFPFDTLRPSSKRDSLSSTHSKTRPTHFRPTPFEREAETPNTISAGGRPIPNRHSSLRAPTISLRSSLQSLATLDPPSRDRSPISLASNATSPIFHRPPLPWGRQSPTPHHRESEAPSLSSVDDHPSPNSPATVPSSPTSTAPHSIYPTDSCELAPGDSSSNWSLPNLSRESSPPPPVPSIPGHHRPSRTMPFSPVYPSEAESGYDSPAVPARNAFPLHPNHNPSTRSRRPGAALPTPDDLGEYEEDEDHVGSLPGEAFGFGTHRSMGKAKADKMLGLDTNAKLCSLFMISGVGPTDAAKWVPADNVLGSRMQPQPDSLGFYWRPELLGTAFTGPASEAFEKAMTKGKKMKKDTWPLVMKPPVPGERGPYVPDAGPDGAERLIGQTIKYAHPRDVEVINTSLMPSTTAHYFSFSVPSHSTAASAARARLDSIQVADNRSITSLDQTSTINAKQRQDLQKQAKITYYGATLTVWTCAEPDRARQLADIRSQLRRKHELDSVLRAPITEPLEERTGTSKRSRSGPSWMPYRNASATDLDNSDTETVRSGMTETTRRMPWQAFGADPLNLGGEAQGTKGRGVKGTVQSSDIGIGPLKAGEGDTFWMPYSLTLVSRHPIFDTMIDYIRTSWSMYQKSAKRNLYQMCKVLNHPIPRPGEMYRLNIGRKSDGEEITIETTFPGAVDFDKGLLKTDFQLWPLFQAVDVDGILTAIEIAMSRSGKVIFTSQYTAMLCLAVHTLRYMVELRGWTGVAIPVIHARDVGLAHDDPGPYIFGLPMECRYMLATPSDACIIDLDNNTLSLRTPPPGVVTPRARREKVKHKIFQALGDQYPIERSIPTELKIAFPNNRFRPFHRIFYDGEDLPHFLGERLRSPPWWKANEVMGVFDKIMVDKQKKPTFMQRLLNKPGLNQGDAPITLSEQDIKDTMRRRAVHYIETRDEMDVKVAKINGKLMQLMQEGEKRKRQFQSFERQADLLAEEAARLQEAYKREHAEAERLLEIARQQTQENEKLDGQLKATEGARSTAMRQLSDMQGSIQDLEREREAIMDIIESQISEAIESHAAAIDRLADASTESGAPDTPSSQISSLPTDSQSLPSPLTSKALLPPVSRGVRPGTTESAMSSTSRWTTRTDAISILGLARRGYASANGTGGTDNKRASVETAHGRDEVAIRIAAIQAKLDLALSVAAKNRSESLNTVKPASAGEAAAVDRGEQGEAKQGSGGLGIDVHGGQGLDSGETTPTTRAPFPSIDAPTTKSSEDVLIARSATPTSALIQPIGRPVSRASSITGRSISDRIRPTSRLRIRRDRPSDGASSDHSEPSVPAPILHDKSLTESSSTNSEAEMIVTPSSSALINPRADVGIGKVSETDSERRSSGGSGSSGESLMRRDNRMGGGKMAEMSDEEARRMSTISTTTVTFGPLD